MSLVYSVQYVNVSRHRERRRNEVVFSQASSISGVPFGYASRTSLSISPANSGRPFVATSLCDFSTLPDLVLIDKEFHNDYLMLAARRCSFVYLTPIGSFKNVDGWSLQASCEKSSFLRYRPPVDFSDNFKLRLVCVPGCFPIESFWPLSWFVTSCKKGCPAFQTSFLRFP